jgi:hypothetical protein
MTTSENQRIILEYLQDHEGQRFQTKDLAKTFAMPGQKVRAILFGLLETNRISQIGFGKGVKYYYQQYEGVATYRRNDSIYTARGPAWDYVRERIAEFRAIPSLVWSCK